MTSPSISKSAPLAVNRYALHGRAGHGLAGAYRARDPKTDGLVTVFLYEGGSNKAARPAEVFEAVSAFDHPNVLRVIDHGRDGQTEYLVTEWVEGTTLARLIEAHGRLPEGNVSRLLAQIGQALDHAHAGGLAPWPVSPHNVLVRADGMVKAVPFGLPPEEPSSRGAINTKTPAPTPAPAPAKPASKPEPFAEVAFSLGTTAFEALTGLVWRPEPPGRKSRRPATRALGLTDRIERAIGRATDPDPARRPTSGAEFLKLLRPRPLAGGPKTDTRPPGDNRRECVRHSLGAATNCLIDTALFAGGPTPSEVWPAVVQDVSSDGIGLLLARRCDPGTDLWVELTPGPERAARVLPVTVIQVRKDYYGHWVHGCAFTDPIGDADLAALLTQFATGD